MWSVIVAAGIPTSVLGFCFWMLERRIERREKQQEAAAKWVQIDYSALAQIRREAAITQDKLATEEEMEEGLKNLAAHDHKVDYIITHSPCSSILEQMDGYPDFYAKDYLTDYLDEIKNTTEFEAWMFGHMHVNVSFEEEKCHCIFDEIGRLE